ncbi:hypothetical protein BTN50_0475 [Candidatus Enterovibrio altilux]|uniref:Mobile element protein n=1 Tax=Candidatus Enterovibrio altilux TaxID=1927128 RepID=A0A291B7M9_9GAMM|nr:hypothetical protein BTN50_0475 [Candidatus Enterovibrio luxaltus]
MLLSIRLYRTFITPAESMAKCGMVFLVFNATLTVLARLLMHE